MNCIYKGVAPTGLGNRITFFATKIPPLRGLKRKSIMIFFLTFLRFNAFHYHLSIAFQHIDFLNFSIALSIESYTLLSMRSS